MVFRSLLLSGLFACSAFAQTTAPSLDQSTPRGALKLFFSAQAREDGDVLPFLLIADNPAQQRLIAAVAAQKNADLALTNALVAKFPDQWKSDPRAAQLAALPAVFDKIDQCEQHIDGGTATLRAAGSDQPPVTLKRVNGKWRLPLEVLAPAADPATTEARAHQIEIQVNVMRQAAADVAGGRYSSKDEAIQDVKQRMYTAALADHVESTQPSTR